MGNVCLKNSYKENSSFILSKCDRLIKNLHGPANKCKNKKRFVSGVGVLFSANEAKALTWDTFSIRTDKTGYLQMYLKLALVLWEPVVPMRPRTKQIWWHTTIKYENEADQYDKSIWCGSLYGCNWIWLFKKKSHIKKLRWIYQKFRMVDVASNGNWLLGLGNKISGRFSFRKIRLFTCLFVCLFLSCFGLLLSLTLAISKSSVQIPSQRFVTGKKCEYHAKQITAEKEQGLEMSPKK